MPAAKLLDAADVKGVERRLLRPARLAEAGRVIAMEGEGEFAQPREHLVARKARLSEAGERADLDVFRDPLALQESCAGAEQIGFPHRGNVRMAAQHAPQQRRARARRAEDDDARMRRFRHDTPIRASVMSRTAPASAANSRGGSWLMKSTGLAVRP